MMAIDLFSDLKHSESGPQISATAARNLLSMEVITRGVGSKLSLSRHGEDSVKKIPGSGS